MHVLAWVAAAVVAAWPIGAALASPLLPSRDLIWVVGGMAGVVALSLLLVQPLLAIEVGTGAARRWRRWHGAVGLLIGAAIVLHVGALYATSPDDITDALLLVAPTPFSLYGVIGLWATVVTIALALARRILRLPFRPWRMVHSLLALVIVAASASHAWMIDGAMEGLSKTIVVLAALAATSFAVIEINLLAPMRRARRL